VVGTIVMKADYITYKQATGASLGGLVLQVVLTTALLIYGVVSKDHAAVSGSIFAGIGVLSWLTLAIVFDQHRRERVELIEADALASSPLAGTSVFSGSADDFRPAARRLAALHKYFVPTMSVIISGLFIGTGIVRFLSGKLRVDTEDFTASLHEGWALGIGLGVAVLGFIFARFTAGLAKFEPMANLRAGASLAIGTSLIGLAIGIANFVDLVGTNALVRYVQVVVPAFIVLIGVELFLHFLLGLYRPRKAGDVPRPAFDSRLLGFLAAPDKIAESISGAINYQLGFDVTSGWFYQLLSRALVPLILFGLLVVWLLSAVAVVRPHQRGMILRFGAVWKDNVAPGMHLKWPWPIDSLYVPEYYKRDRAGRLEIADRTVTGLRTIELGTSPPATTEPILWTNDHAGEEIYQLVRTGKLAAAGTTGATPSKDAAAEESKSDLSDLSVISAEIPLIYVVKDVLRFDEFAPPQQRDIVLKSVAQRELVRFFQTITLDEVLGGTRLDLSRRLRNRVQAAFDGMNVGPDGKARGAGVEVVDVAVVGVHPPKDTAMAFETPVQADQKLQANIEAARTDEIRSLTEVAGQVTLARQIVEELNKLDGMRDQKASADALTAQEFKVQKMLESAGGSSAAVLAAAQADRWNRHMSIRAIAARQEGRVALYEAAPEIFKARAYFETMKKVLSEARLYITPARGIMIDFNGQERDLGTDIFTPGTPGGGG